MGIEIPAESGRLFGALIVPGSRNQADSLRCGHRTQCHRVIVSPNRSGRILRIDDHPTTVVTVVTRLVVTRRPRIG